MDTARVEVLIELSSMTPMVAAAFLAIWKVGTNRSRFWTGLCLILGAAGFVVWLGYDIWAGHLVEAIEDGFLLAIPVYFLWSGWWRHRKRRRSLKLAGEKSKALLKKVLVALPRLRPVGLPRPAPT